MNTAKVYSRLVHSLDVETCKDNDLGAPLVSESPSYSTAFSSGSVCDARLKASPRARQQLRRQLGFEWRRSNECRGAGDASDTPVTDPREMGWLLTVLSILRPVIACNHREEDAGWDESENGMSLVLEQTLRIFVLGAPKPILLS